MKKHHYNISVTWTGNLGTGTSSYRAYSRNHEVKAIDKPIIPASSDPSFKGDPTRYNPEELLVASLSQCHMLWFLHLCSEAGITVIAYIDEAMGTMEEDDNGGGRFTEVILRRFITISKPDQKDLIEDLHRQANKLCFIANSCNFPVKHEGKIMVENSNAENL
ncbi:MAG: OsmC family protein [Saprospiraceae bacterium]|nr:OsmC family protein [Saprospiraceae bacterium]